MYVCVLKRYTLVKSQLRGGAIIASTSSDVPPRTP